MYRRILVPVDGSATSKLGLRHALGLAKDQHARIRVMNVLDDLALAPMLDGYPVDITMLIDSMKASGDKALDEAIRLAQKAASMRSARWSKVAVTWYQTRYSQTRRNSGPTSS